MGTIQAIFTAFGASRDVLSLADGRLKGIIQQHLSVGDNNPATNEPFTSNCVIIKLPLPPDDDAVAIRSVQYWLESNRSLLEAIDAKKYSNSRFT